MSKFTVKVFSSDRVDLYSCNSVRVLGRKIIMSNEDDCQVLETFSVGVLPSEASYIENAVGKTVYTMPKDELPEEKPSR